MILTLSTLSTITRCLLLDPSKQRILFSETLTQSQNQSIADELGPCVSKLLKDSGTSLQDIQEIYVFTGPGTFTGLRIGVNFARGLSESQKIPLRAIPTRLIADESIFIPMRPLLAKEIMREELLEGKMEFLEITQDGGAHLKKPLEDSFVLGSKENWEWPSEEQILTALQKCEGQNYRVEIDYGINPKINGVVQKP